MKPQKENNVESSHIPLSSITFEDACIRQSGSNFSKFHTDVLVTMTRKEIFVGRDGNWKIKWKDVITLELSDQGLNLESANKIFHLKAPEETSWPKFRTLLQTRWNKVLGLNDQMDTVSSEAKPAIITRRKQSQKVTSKRVYGTKSSRHYSILQSALRNKDIQWSDEEPEVSTTSFTSPSKAWNDHQDMDIEQRESIPSDNNDEASFALSDDTGNEPKLIQDNFQKSETKRKRRLVKKQIRQDDDSEDEALFEDPPITTLIGSRLVTPRALMDDDLDESDQEIHTDQPSKKPKESVDDQKRLSDFFSPKTNTLKQSLPAKTTRDASTIKPKIIPLPVEATSLERDHLQWIERTPPKLSLKKSLDTPKETTLPDLFEKPPSKAAEIVLPPKAFNSIRDSIEDFDDDEKETKTQTNVRVVRRSFRRPLRVYGKSKADYVLDTAVTTPRKISFDRAFQIDRDQSQARSPLRIDSSRKLHWTGLRNLGNTCYLNSSLQLFFTLSDFFSSLVGRGGKLSQQLIEVSRQLRESPLSSVSPRKIKDVMDDMTDRFSGYEQRDAHEFLSELIDRIHDELTDDADLESEDNSNSSCKKTSSSVLTDEFFRLNLNVCLKCDNCGYER
jgi:Ubiquitin carboxyl-terminal hydrolase